MSESVRGSVPSARQAAGGEVLSRIADAVCQHCGGRPFPMGADDEASVALAVDDDERWLWQIVEDGEKAERNAPDAPTPEEVAAARRAYGAATATLTRVESQIAAIEAALSRPATWFRPKQRAALAAAQRRARAAQIAATTTREQAGRAAALMESTAAARRTYLSTHRALIEAATQARAELDGRVDAVIDAYSRSAEPPMWFRFGLGYPPTGEAYDRWLSRARLAIAYRRRHRIEHPLEPTGGMLPE